MGTKRLGRRLMERVLLAYWRRVDDFELPPSISDSSMNPSDNVQIALNLVMPLADPSAIGRARLAQELGPAMPEVFAGLSNTGIVHFGRLTVVDDNINLFTIYDGDFTNYVRDFIYNVGGAFNIILSFVKDAPPLPVEEHPDRFIEWVKAHDALQIPDDATVISDDLLKLPRRLAIVMADNNAVQYFVYRSYPGYSAAQIRHALKIGW